MQQLISTLISMRPFIPAQDFELSKHFYRDLGFTLLDDGQNIVELRLGQYSVLLQNYYEKSWAENCMQQLLVTNIDSWWQYIESLELDKKYAVKPPVAPTMQPWGLKVAYIHDPSGVLWHISEAPSSLIG